MGKVKKKILQIIPLLLLHMHPISIVILSIFFLLECFFLENLVGRAMRIRMFNVGINTKDEKIKYSSLFILSLCMNHNTISLQKKIQGKDNERFTFQSDKSINSKKIIFS